MNLVHAKTNRDLAVLVFLFEDLRDVVKLRDDVIVGLAECHRLLGDVRVEQRHDFFFERVHVDAAGCGDEDGVRVLFAEV
jgi:hypothetical protein